MLTLVNDQYLNFNEVRYSFLNKLLISIHGENY